MSILVIFSIHKREILFHISLDFSKQIDVSFVPCCYFMWVLYINVQQGQTEIQLWALDHSRQMRDKQEKICSMSMLQYKLEARDIKTLVGDVIYGKCFA